jgi:acetyltransferase-like isoleucine patch superfamily enzyme
MTKVEPWVLRETRQYNDGSVIRSLTVIYPNTKIGNNLMTGHHVLIRENCKIGNDVSIGSFCDIEDNVIIGDNVRLHSGVFIPALTVIEDDVWIGPNVTFCNDKYPNTARSRRLGVIVKRGAIIGANATILSGIVIGENSIVGAGSVVLKSVQPKCIVAGNPAKIVRHIDESCELAKTIPEYQA